MHTIKKICFFSICMMCLATCTPPASKDFVQVKNKQFMLGNKPYYFIGTNYWYGGLLGLDEAGKQRLTTELDFLKAHGVENLRVVAAIEGSGQINGVERIQPPTQPTQGTFDERVSIGLDHLLSEMAKRNMKAVLYLSNNWEWSGGFLQYLNWNGLLADSILKRKLTWNENRDLVSQFYDCKNCKDAYTTQLEYLLKRTNSINGKKYINDETIMAWELANEPRPMRPTAIASYKQWIKDVAAHIKSIDPNHLITIGTEGEIGTENMQVYEAIHADKNIDYLTIHIWAKNWEWFTGNELSIGFDSVVAKAKNYILRHEAIASKLSKPLVIEEFGLPRDLHSFDPNATTVFRDRYFKEILDLWNKSKQARGPIAGLNFWAFGGTARPIALQEFWKPGNDYMGDPPMEAQGLNTVFDSDSSTWKIINAYSKPRP